MKITSPTSCLPYCDVIQEQPGTLVRKRESNLLFVVYLCSALNVYISVYVHFTVLIQRDVCNFFFFFFFWSALSTKRCHISNLSYSSSSSSLPSVTVPFYFPKWCVFINVYLNGSASLPAVLWKCNNTKGNTVLPVALHSLLWCKDVFHPDKLGRHKESIALF